MSYKLMINDNLFKIPYPRNECFTGREDELYEIHKSLTRESNQYFAICGLGGIGKTQLAVEYAHRYRYNYSHILWLSVSDIESNGFVNLANDLGLNQQQQLLSPSQIINLIKKWLTENPGWLLIMDGINDFRKTEKIFSELFAIPTVVKVLLTTRYRTSPIGVSCVKLNGLNQYKGAELLLRSIVAKYTVTYTDIDYANANALSQTLQGFPLALSQAAAYINANQSSFAEYLQDYSRYETKLLALRGIYKDHPLSVTETFLESIDEIRQKEPMAFNILNYCAHNGISGTTEDLLMSVFGVNRLVLDKYLKLIFKHSMLTVGTGNTRTFFIHSLVQAVLLSL